MSAEVEDLLREGMCRFTEEVRAPAGLVGAARRRRRQRAVRRAVAAGGAATVAVAAAAAVLAAGSGPAAAPPPGRAQYAAYVVSRVKSALATSQQVFRGVTRSSGGQSSITWAFGDRNRFEEFTGDACGHVTPAGVCTHRGGSEPALASGTALAGGKLVAAYVTYYNRAYSLSPVITPAPGSACGTTAALSMGGPPVPTAHWAAFIDATLACGQARVTGHVRVGDMETTRITGQPVTVRLSRGYAAAVHERYARATWTLYVSPVSYLPVRITGTTRTSGGPGHPVSFSSVTDVSWLPPTPANTAQALVTIPPGFHRVSAAASR